MSAQVSPKTSFLKYKLTKSNVKGSEERAEAAIKASI
jgi:hypothetical protein